MTARVGAESEWVYGSPPPSNVPNLMTHVGVQIQGTTRYVAGHLLNDNMGGKGTNDNLTVLSSDANKAHRGIEGKVKDLAIKADQINAGSTKHGDPKFDHGARYSVEVLDPNPVGTPPFSPKEQFIGEGLQVSIIPIRFDRAGNESAWPEETAGENHVVDHIIPNVPPYPAVPKTKKPTKLQNEVVSAIRANGNKGSSVEEIFKNVRLRTGEFTEKGVKAALKRGVKFKFFSRRGAKYKIVVKNLRH